MLLYVSVLTAAVSIFIPSILPTAAASSINHHPSASVSSPTFTGPYFYMYPLEEIYWWRWPRRDSDCSGSGYIAHEHSDLSGSGRILNETQGLFLSWHFGMFSLLFNRYRRSKYRTMDPEKASVFIIPYDIGLDGFVNRDTCASRKHCTASLIGNLTDMLVNSTYFNRYEGADHVVLWSLGNYHPWPKHCSDLMRNTCKRCTFTCYWMDGFKRDNNFISVPFPAGYHYIDGMSDTPWLPGSRVRNITAVYLGSAKTLNPENTKTRRAMIQQCSEHDACDWRQLAHSSKDEKIASLLTIYREAVFCLCPPGDDPGRKAVFDVILSGCIPVIFHLETLYNQYPWHLGEDTALDISVYIPGPALREGKVNFMDVLLSIPEDIIRRKQDIIAEVAPRLQYALPPLDLLRQRRDESPWDPPFIDAAEVTLLGIFERTKKAVAGEATGIPDMSRSKAEMREEYSSSAFVKLPGEKRKPYDSLAIKS